MTKSETVKTKSHDLVDTLKTERDELKVKMHLASLEVQDDWRVVEDKWEQFKFKTAKLEKEAGSSAHELGEAISILGSELKESYKRFRKII